MQKDLMEKTIPNIDNIPDCVENSFTTNPAEFYSRDIEELPDNWNVVIVNNGEHTNQ